MDRLRPSRGANEKQERRPDHGPVDTGLDDRYDRRSTLITSQLPVEQWHTYLEDPTVADAILDACDAEAPAPTRRHGGEAA